MALEVTLDPTVLQEQQALLRLMLSNPRTTARQRYLIVELMRMLAQIEEIGQEEPAAAE